jgi:hypothetical protein
MTRSIHRFLLTLCTAIILGITALSAHAQTVINIVSQTCNVAQTACVLQGDGGQVIALDPASVTMVLNDVSYTGSVTSYVPIQSCPPRPFACYRVSYDVTMTFSPTAELTAVRSFTRSGSGRGGWAWHPHWLFETITVY